MNLPSLAGVVYTVRDKCRVCYTCVRECPAKAIKIINGQAEVIHERCIACGNCVSVCSQGAKAYKQSVEAILHLLEDKNIKTAACIAPSFPAEFVETDDYKVVVGMIRKLDFDYVTEVSFGADMVGIEYEKLLNNFNGKTLISSDCPAIVHYIRHYHPNLVENLAPVASPMIAASRVLKQKYGEDLKIVFIGPCIAKKTESDELDYVITFSELRDLFEEKNITFENSIPSDFDEPHSGRGAILPITRGLLQSMGKYESIDEKDIVAASGHTVFPDAIREFEDGSLKTNYLELLCCKGCVMGPGMSQTGQRFSKRTRVKKYVNDKLANFDYEKWLKDIEEFKHLDFSRNIDTADRRLKKPSKEQIDEVLFKLGKTTQESHLNCGACGYRTCEEHAIAIVEGLAEAEMCLPYTIEKLHKSVEELNVSHDKLAKAKQALKQSEKLASMGQLSAGIAHELNNPLGVITMYSNIVREELDVNSPHIQDLELIVEQAERCKNIVSGLLNFARKNQVKLQKCNFEDFVKHSFDNIIIQPNITTEFISEITTKYANLDSDQMMQVLTNLEKNAMEAMPDGGKLTVKISENSDDFIIDVIDTGTGISPENMDKIFTPFFTTKEVGKGTGLGLPLIYGIIKMHKGKIDVESNDNPLKKNTGTTFKISIPKNLS